MRVLMACAVNPGTNITKSDIAEKCNASKNHLGQVIRQLARLGYVRALRGRNGGLVLAMPASDIRVGAVFRLFEADLPFAECFDEKENNCPLIDTCWLKPALKKAVESFYETLDEISLADLVEGNRELEDMLYLPLRRSGGALSGNCIGRSGADAS
ncbi:RrF2 family transcriptional regulator [Oricola thermophila]|nr:Rrf2 family transcriptional regulator [Oricola thermophila]